MSIESFAAFEPASTTAAGSVGRVTPTGATSWALAVNTIAARATNITAAPTHFDVLRLYFDWLKIDSTTLI